MASARAVGRSSTIPLREAATADEAKNFKRVCCTHAVNMVGRLRSDPYPEMQVRRGSLTINAASAFAAAGRANKGADAEAGIEKDHDGVSQGIA